MFGKFESISEAVFGVEPSNWRDQIVKPGFKSAIEQAGCQCIQRIRYETWVGFLTGIERVFNAEMQLPVVVENKPDPAAAAERFGLRDFAKFQKRSIEEPGLRLTACRYRELNVIEIKRHGYFRRRSSR
jgi:hypothetical protein